MQNVSILGIANVLMQNCLFLEIANVLMQNWTFLWTLKYWQYMLYILSKSEMTKDPRGMVEVKAIN